jgi:hypothetical protein
MNKLPDVIYLQAYDEEGNLLSELDDEMTWCQDKINDTDVEYIRKDLVDKFLNSIYMGEEKNELES